MSIVKKIAIVVSVAVAIIIIVAILFEMHLTNCTKDTFIQTVANSDRKFIVEEIDNYRSTNHRLPASLSELGFEQTLTSYVRNHNTFNLVRLGSSYVLDFGMVKVANGNMYLMTENGIMNENGNLSHR